MKKILLFLCFTMAYSCGSTKKTSKDSNEFTIAFGSCNKASLPNLLWDDIQRRNPDVWIWGGDNIYADTDDMEKLKRMYTEQKAIPGYSKLINTVDVIGTWDDHDYGLNDGGVEFAAKRESQQEFLDFMDVPASSPRRQQEGIYTSHEYKQDAGKVKIIVSDTRYFRTALTPDTETKKRIKPNAYGEGTVLGNTQWTWLEKQLSDSDADFNIIVSSIQVLSNEHGFECWGNFPHEVDRLKRTIADSGAKGVLILSGDRHISEISSAKVKGLAYPLVDFTSSGLTHAYSKFKGEPNPFRVGEVVSTESFGSVLLNFRTKTAVLQIVGDNGTVLGEVRQGYE
ncbi:alkaline phosphatase D family protein [Maribacter chungangensis]|uniref:Alkaline phosphatase D family protein n=1 Tax=Maribacter chungangensis TaxID=1069117 RepID=A0ABW3B5L2_9FLAO